MIAVFLSNAISDASSLLQTACAGASVIEVVSEDLLNHQEPVRRNPVLRNSGFWEDVVPSWTDVQFKAEYRVNRQTFEKIASFVEEYMRTTDTTFKLAIPVRKKIAIALVVRIVEIMETY